MIIMALPALFGLGGCLEINFGPSQIESPCWRAEFPEGRTLDFETVAIGDTRELSIVMRLIRNHGVPEMCEVGEENPHVLTMALDSPDGGYGILNEPVDLKEWDELDVSVALSFTPEDVKFYEGQVVFDLGLGGPQTSLPAIQLFGSSDGFRER